MPIDKAKRPFFEAALALFSAGCPPTVVAEKFDPYISYSTALRWYHDWAELKGIPRENRYRARKKNEPRHVYEFERKAKEVAKDKRRRKEEKLARQRNRVEIEIGEIE